MRRRDELGRRDAIVTHEPGGFFGELSQLSGRPALVDAYAEGPVDALIIPPEKLRAGRPQRGSSTSETRHPALQQLSIERPFARSDAELPVKRSIGRRMESGPMRRLLIALFVMQGCATHVVSSNERSVIIESQWLDVARAQELAEAECAKHSRIAQMTIKADPWERNYVFYCIDR
ncbi:MAG: cyclic nucleotide-binding domain-containing protein [Candidatus Binatia bacterium]